MRMISRRKEGPSSTRQRPPLIPNFASSLLKAQTCVVLFLFFEDFLNGPVSGTRRTGIGGKPCLLDESIVRLNLLMLHSNSIYPAKLPRYTGWI